MPIRIDVHPAQAHFVGFTHDWCITSAEWSVTCAVEDARHVSSVDWVAVEYVTDYLLDSLHEW